jgi:hypothetical protein
MIRSSARFFDLVAHACETAQGLATGLRRNLPLVGDAQGAGAPLAPTSNEGGGELKRASVA